MANHTITVISQNNGSGNQDGRSSNIQRIPKATSVKSNFEKRSSKQNIINGMRINKSSLKKAVSATAGIAPALAIVGMVAKASEASYSIYSSVMMSKTGEKMKYHNINQGYSMATNPISYFKKSIWNYGILKPMEIARQNEILDYDRQLTGNVILSGSQQKGTF